MNNNIHTNLIFDQPRVIETIMGFCSNGNIFTVSPKGAQFHQSIQGNYFNPASAFTKKDLLEMIDKTMELNPPAELYPFLELYKKILLIADSKFSRNVVFPEFSISSKRLVKTYGQINVATEYCLSDFYLSNIIPVISGKHNTIVSFLICESDGANNVLVTDILSRERELLVGEVIYGSLASAPTKKDKTLDCRYDLVTKELQHLTLVLFNIIPKLEKFVEGKTFSEKVKDELVLTFTI